MKFISSITHSQGCAERAPMLLPLPLICMSERKNVTQGLKVFCCNDRDFCNEQLPSIPVRDYASTSLLWLVLLITLITVLTLVITIYWFINSRKSYKLKSYILKRLRSQDGTSGSNKGAIVGLADVQSIDHRPGILSTYSLVSSPVVYETPGVQVPLLNEHEIRERNAKFTAARNDLTANEVFNSLTNAPPHLRVTDYTNYTNYTGSSSTSGFNSTGSTSAPMKDDTVSSTSINNPVKYPDAFSGEDVDGQFSSSGYGAPLLIQRSIARQIVLKEVIGRGRFGEVWKGLWRDEHVAVKIFSSRDESCWQREVEIYQTCMLRHENILGFISADNKDNGTYIQLFLITEYYDKGSLYDYLNNNSLNTDEMICMAHSIVSGLSHLHYEIDGLQGKPPIAHRDLKSKNILVRSNKSCVIADLGLAVRQVPYSREVDLPSARKVGTRRYLPPEVLIDQQNTSQFDFEAFRMGDIYSLGLVLWELANRTHFTVDLTSSDVTDELNVAANEYNLPYQDMVSRDPTIDEMKNVVATLGKRPHVRLEWNQNQSMKRMASIISDCWVSNPTARLTTLRAKKNLAALKESQMSAEKV